MHVKELLSLKDKVVLITGGEGKYGRCITEGLAEADAMVITASPFLDEGEKVATDFRDKGLNVEAMLVDQANHESVMNLKQQLKDKYGRLDVLVNCAVARPMKGYNGSLEQWKLSMDINATGLFDITREMADLMAQGGGGTIVNIASMMGMFGPDLSNYEGLPEEWKDQPADYFFHKGGMLTLTRYLARVLADKNIRVNAVSPGIVTGTARVILRTDDNQHVEAGEILVAPFTDPAWTPYFLPVAGVVMDMGGILSHGAIIAREYGITPSVTI